MIRWTQYHSHDWHLLVETGWITHTVETMPDGQRYAMMVRREWQGY